MVVQSVELLLDLHGDVFVRANWAALQREHLPSQGRIAAASNRPHVTVAVFPRPDDAIESQLESAASRLARELPLSVVLGGLVIFPGHHPILARLVVPTAALLRLQRIFADVVGSFGPIQETMRPDGWTPHITLARGLSVDNLGTAVGVIGSGHAVVGVGGIRRWDGSAKREWLIAGSWPAPIRRIETDP
jgi:2'-5' RNA ligase